MCILKRFELCLKFSFLAPKTWNMVKMSISYSRRDDECLIVIFVQFTV